VAHHGVVQQRHPRGEEPGRRQPGVQVVDALDGIAVCGVHRDERGRGGVEVVRLSGAHDGGHSSTAIA
jgi:hypothetical protein